MAAHPAFDESDQMGFRFEIPRAETRRIWGVAELVSEVRAHIEREYASVWIEGEISNCRPAPSGHLYFTLKDGDAQLPVVLFRKQAALLRFRPEDGLHVLARGKVSVYEQRGQMQLVAEHMEPLGAGSLQLAFEQLKAKLQQEGLFDAARKKELPPFPHCVGVVTSPTGAVIRDFLNVVSRRHAALDVLVYPAMVQGEGAAAEVAAGIAYFNKSRSVDVIVIARGGGSLEDLAAFNSEGLARAIGRSELPVVSAVGHETDFTIADFVADLRAPTPSAAAELITTAQHRVEERVALLIQRLERACRYHLIQSASHYAKLSVETAFARLQDSFGRRQQRVDELRFRLEAALRAELRKANSTVAALTNRLAHQDATHRLRVAHSTVDSLESRMLRAQQGHLERCRARLQSLQAGMHALSPLAVLERGYALAFSEDGRLVKDASALRAGERLQTRFARGSAHSTVTATHPESDAKA